MKNKKLIDTKTKIENISALITKRRALEASEETASMLLSLLSEVEKNKRSIDDFSKACKTIFFDIPHSRELLPTDITGLLLLGADLSWYYYGDKKEKRWYFKWKNDVKSQLKKWQKTKNLSNRTILLKPIRIGESYITVPYPHKKGD